MLLLLITVFTLETSAQTPQWEFMGLAGEEIYDIAVDDSGNVFVASWTGIFKSTDNGSTWAFKNNGLQIGDVYKLFIDYAGNIYLCGSANFPGYGLYKSTDGGENWVGIADTLNGGPINYFEDVTIIPNEPGGFIYVSNYYGVYRSTDNGITWQSTNYTDKGARYIGINTNNFMFFANNTASWYGIYRSNDFGLTWVRQTLLGAMSLVYLRDGSILAGCYDPGLGEAGIYRTTDNGNNWINTNTFTGISTPSDFTLDTNNDIYVSYAGFAVYLSTNNGNSWTNYGLSGLEYSVMCMAIDSGGYIWVGSHLDGVYKTAGRTIPVELVSFTAEVNDNNVLLSWVTASEINNQGFQVERRETKDERSGVWNNIGYINGKGTTTEQQSYSYVDQNLSANKYQYRLKQIDYDGTFDYSKTIEVEINSPTRFSLEQNYPNPFNPETNIDYMLPIETIVNISLYDITGRKIKELVNEKKQPGYYTVKLKGDELSSGIYFYRLFTTSGYAAVKKISVIK
ncbi:MAG: T9SS type A sorting domain-containing protein [Ignavibacterium sp.]|nr:T9SS type A sorting domain-containing protein [Ignavibacterium sp.]